MSAHFRFTDEAWWRIQVVTKEEKYLLADGLRAELGSPKHTGVPANRPGEFLLNVEGYAVVYRPLNERELVEDQARFGYMIVSLEPITDLLYRRLR